MTRRELLAGAAALAAARPAAAQPGAARPNVVVVGAGVFGAWTAKKLQDSGRRVLLIDAWGPAHARASSGGESRMTRGAYGADEIYTRMALSSLAEWQALSRLSGLPIFAPTGVLFFFPDRDPYALATIEVHRRLGLPTEVLGREDMARRFPAIDFAGVEIGLFEPQFGVLMARRAVQTLVMRFVEAGGSYLAARVLPPEPGQARLTQLRMADGQTVSAERFVFAAGP